MRLSDEQDERGFSTPVIYTIVVVSALILIILACVLVSNSKKPSRNNLNSQRIDAVPTEAPKEEIEFAEGQKDIETLYKEDKLRSEDLDFWNMYEKEEPVVEVEPTPTPKPTPTPTPTDEEKAADGKHIQVSYKDGTQEWIEIDEELTKHSYDFTKLKATNGKMVYYEGNKKISRLGVTLSAENGEVDFEDLKADGIDFVMLKVGARGYETGLITLDEAFVSNMQKAKDAGLKIGVYFCSQAVTVEEAVEEVEFIANQLIPYEIAYPVAYRIEAVSYDAARTDILDKEKKTQMAETFLSEMEKAGHDVIIYAEQNWLLTEVLTKELLDKYEIWLSDRSPVPEFPYQFKMWEYAQGETALGVNGDVNYTISFVDYSQR